MLAWVDESTANMAKWRLVWLDKSSAIVKLAFIYNAKDESGELRGSWCAEMINEFVYLPEAKGVNEAKNATLLKIYRFADELKERAGDMYLDTFKTLLKE